MISMTGFAVWPIYLIELQKSWNLSNSEAGWISGSFYIGYVIATPLLVMILGLISVFNILLINTNFCFSAIFSRGFPL